MKFRHRPSLLAQLFAALAVGVVIGFFAPDWLIRLTNSFRDTFGQFIKFIVPFIILGLVTPAIIDTGKSAGRLLLMTIGLAWVSTVVFGYFAYGVSLAIFPNVLSGSLDAAAAAKSFPAYFVLKIPPVMDVVTSLVVSLVIGFGSIAIGAEVCAKAADELRRIVMLTLRKAFVPFLPFYILTVMADLTASGKLKAVGGGCLVIMAVALATTTTVLVLQFLVAGAVARKNPFRCLLNMLPAYLTGWGCCSSAATIPYTLECTKKNGVSDETASLVIPLCSSMHMAGSMANVVVYSAGLLVLLGQGLPLANYTEYILLVSFVAVASPGVPGGVVLATSAIAEAALGFTPERYAIMIALYMALDGMGTACNLTGDGAIAIVVDRLRKWRPSPGKASLLLFAAFLSFASLAAAPHAHCLSDSVSLDGAWEMAYRPYDCESIVYPAFAGKRVEKAVPGYWEDMVPAFRAAGIADDFRINPQYGRQGFPIFNWADDLTLPNIRGSFFYRRTVELTRTDRAYLAFEGVRNQVHAWVNGRFIAFHAGFSTPFELAIPEGVLRKGTNEIVLAVSNCSNPGYGDFVSGLTTRAVFRSTGGVNGSVALRFPKADLADVCVLTAKDGKSFEIRVSGRDPFAYEIADGERILASGEAKGPAPAAGAAASRRIVLPTAGLAFWSPENPKRYTLRIRTAKGVSEQLFGLRRLVADGERLRLNGSPVYLRGVTEHCYFPLTVHLPRDLGYYRMITRKRKELGFNFVRFHTFVPPVEYLEATDELGMLVEIESPNFVSEPEYAAIVAFARRHPSVVIYSTGNETRIDRLAEAYLSDVSRIVHAETDSLFSPMSAMRGVEYALMEGKDVIVRKPFWHNAERMGRLADYCDLFNAYQLGAFSYESLNGASSAEVDRQGDAYCGKPRLAHEICIDSSYVDLSTERLYPADSPILKAGVFSGLRESLSRRGILARADLYYRHSCEWMRRIRKFTFEKVRASDRIAGYDFLGDINTHWHTFGYSVGMMDEFYRLKPGETPEIVRRYNSAAVLLSDLGSDFNVTAGSAKKVAFSLSNFEAAAPNARMTVALVRDGKSEFERTFALGSVPNGCVSKLATCEVAVPESAVPRKYLLRAAFAGGRVAVQNEWEVYAFPKVAEVPAPSNVRVVTDISETDLLAAMERGDRVLLFGPGPFRHLPTTFRIGMAGRTSGNLATVVADHPSLAGLPHEGYCGWQFRRLMEGGSAVQLEAGVPFDPIVDVASSVKRVIRQSMLFEYRVGKGRLMVCSFAFRADDPAAVWLKDRLVAYAGSDAFAPRTALTSPELKAVLSAPLLTGTANANVARNPNDPSSNVRAGVNAQE